MTHLLDSDVLIALCTPDHPHNHIAKAWVSEAGRFSTCPITEGALVRFVVRNSPTGSKAYSLVLGFLLEFEGREFWAADLPFAEADLGLIQGHKQVTDAYLVALAAFHGGSLVTFDKALAATHSNAILLSAQQPTDR